MGSIEVDGVLVSCGERFKCPICQKFNYTKEFLNRIWSGTFKKSDIICGKCFEKQLREIEAREMNQCAQKDEKSDIICPNCFEKFNPEK